MRLPTFSESVHSFSYRNGVLHCEDVDLEELIDDEDVEPLSRKLDVTILHHFIINQVFVGNPEFELEEDECLYIRDLRSVCDLLKRKKAGLAFNPDMPISRVEPFLRDIDLALCMTVFPGFGGQAYITESTARVRELRALVNKHNPACEIEVDGGIDAKTIGLAAAAGANVFVAGTAVFGAKEGPTAAVKELARLAQAK